MANEYRIKGKDISEYISSTPSSTNLVWPNFKINNRDYPLAEYDVYDSNYHKYNPLPNLSKYFVNVNNSNENFANKLLGKGYKPALATPTYSLTSTSRDYELYYSYDKDEDNQFITGHALIKYKNSSGSLYRITCAPVLTLEAVGGGGGGGCAYIFPPFAYRDAHGGGSAGYCFLVYDMSWAGQGTTNQYLSNYFNEHNTYPDDNNTYFEYDDIHYYKVADIKVGSYGSAGYKSSGNLGGNSGGAGGDTIITFHFHENKYIFTLNGGTGGSDNTSGKGGSVEEDDSSASDILKEFIWNKYILNGQNGKENGGTNTITISNHMYDVNTALNRSQTTGNVANPGGCTPLGRGGEGRPQDGSISAYAGYGAGGGGGIPWFAYSGNNMSGTSGGQGICILSFDRSISNINFYTLSFDANGGSLSSSSSIQVAEDSMIGTLPIPTREEYNFMGWYIDNELITDTSMYVWNSNKTAIAQWEDATQTTLILSADGGSFDSNATITINGDNYVVAENNEYPIKLNWQYRLPSLNTIHRSGYEPSYWSYFTSNEDNIQLLLPIATEGIWDENLALSDTMNLSVMYNIQNTAIKPNLHSIKLNPNNAYVNLQYYDPSISDYVVINYPNTNNDITLYVVENSNRLYYLDSNGIYWELVNLGTSKELLDGSEDTSSIAITQHLGYYDDSGYQWLSPSSNFRLNKNFTATYITSSMEFSFISSPNLSDLISYLELDDSIISEEYAGYNWYRLFEGTEIVNGTDRINSSAYIYEHNNEYGIAYVQGNDIHIIYDSSNWYISYNNMLDILNEQPQDLNIDKLSTNFTLNNINYLANIDAETSCNYLILSHGDETIASSIYYGDELVAQFDIDTSTWIISKDEVSVVVDDTYLIQNLNYRYKFSIQDGNLICKMYMLSINEQDTICTSDEWVFSFGSQMTFGVGLNNWIKSNLINYNVSEIQLMLNSRWGDIVTYTSI